MAHVITQACCNDATCTAACPVNCIHPTPDEPEYATAEMLYIDPARCIDCGACLEACPVDAIVRSDDLTADDRVYLDLNAAYYADRTSTWAPDVVTPAPPARAGAAGPLRVAVVGTGPSATFAAEELLGRRDLDVEITMFDRLPVPGGLLRFGVAPDHHGTRRLGRWFERTLGRAGLSLHLHVEIGRDITHAELLAHHHAVVYGVGAREDRRMGVPGEDLPGSHSAQELVAWYNGHPDAADRTFDLSAERAVVVGNGNVALDVARILLSRPEELAHTDIADHALGALARSAVSEVVVLGRRGPAHLAATTPELLALGRLPDLDVTISGAEWTAADASAVTGVAGLKARVLAGYAAQPVGSASRRIDLRFLRSPEQVTGTSHVTGLRAAVTVPEPGADGRTEVVPTGESEEIECGLVLRAIGHRGRPISGLPFDDRAGVVPNEGGRVVDPETGAPVTGSYVVGWIKRGPTGVLGTNRRCAAGTVETLLEDWRAGRLRDPGAGPDELAELVRRRCPTMVDRAGWRRIDGAERRAGGEVGRPRRNLVTIEGMLAAAADRA